MRFPDKLDVLTVHARLIAETGGTGGIRDEGLLESELREYLAPNAKRALSRTAFARD